MLMRCFGGGVGATLPKISHLSLYFILLIMIAATFYADGCFFLTFDSGTRSAGEGDTLCIIEELSSLL